MPKEAAPHPALRPYVRSMRHYDIEGFPAGEHIGLPSATVTLVLPLGAPLDLSMPGTGRRSMISCLAGLRDGPVTIHHDGTQRGLQLALTPLGLEALLGVPAGVLAHDAVGLDAAVGHRDADTLLDRIHSTPDWPGRLEVLETFLLDRLTRAPRRPVRPELLWAWSVLTGSGGTARVGDVAAGVGWSNRHLTAQFDVALGTGPKTVARLVRFERSAAMIGAGDDLAGVAARCEYADQPHLTREWRRLAGTTPARWPRDDALANVQDAPEPDHRG